MWRVRTTLPDRPGALARLAAACGDAGVNIVGLQVFPQDQQVTDELVVRTPGDWSSERLRTLVEGAGGRDVVIVSASVQVLADQPTRYVQAARAVLADPNRFPEVLARLLDADPGADAGEGAGAGAGAGAGEGAGAAAHVLDVEVGQVFVQVARSVAFTDGERARAVAIAELLRDVLAREAQLSPAERALAVVPGEFTGEPEYVTDVDSVTAWADGVVVGVAMLKKPSATQSAHPAGQGRRSRQLVLRVSPAHRRRGIGTRLLTMIVREAARSRLDEIVMTTAADNAAVMPMVLGSGLIGRIRMTGESLTVRIPLGDTVAGGSRSA